MRTRLRLKRWIDYSADASFTVEAAVVMGVFVMIVAGFLSFGIRLYGEIINTASYVIEQPTITNAKVVRMKLIGGEIYEQFSGQHMLPEEA